MAKKKEYSLGVLVVAVIIGILVGASIFYVFRDKEKAVIIPIPSEEESTGDIEGLEGVQRSGGPCSKVEKKSYITGITRYTWTCGEQLYVMAISDEGCMVNIYNTAYTDFSGPHQSFEC